MSTAITQRERDADTLIPHEQPGMLAMATMPEEEFEQRLASLKKGQERIRLIKRKLMEKDSHYGIIPGTDKPALLKPGAELLCSIYGLRPDFIPAIEHGDGATEPSIRVTMRCELHLGDMSGPVVAVGYGASNSWERKHRYRREKRTCPACGVVGSVIRGKEEYGGGWLCWKKEGGCGAKWPEGTAKIEQQVVGDTENPDPHDLENTLLKMAKKRAHIDATLTGTASSDLFTQDIDEGPPEPPAKPAQKQSGAKPAQAAPAEREPGSDDEDGPPRARIPVRGSAAWIDPAVLGAECVRLTGKREEASRLLENLIGKTSVRGLKATEIATAWERLEMHTTFGKAL